MVPSLTPAATATSTVTNMATVLTATTARIATATKNKKGEKRMRYNIYYHLALKVE